MCWAHKKIKFNAEQELVVDEIYPFGDTSPKTAATTITIGAIMIYYFKGAGDRKKSPACYLKLDAISI